MQALRSISADVRTLVMVITFSGIGESLEDVLVWGVTPLLKHVDITFFKRRLFEVPQRC
jgi:hypothetical protein